MPKLSFNYFILCLLSLANSGLMKFLLLTTLLFSLLSLILTQCAVGCYNSAGTCTSCSTSNCARCDSTGCTKCKSGYQLSGSSCVSCTGSPSCIECAKTHCLQCESDGTCLGCASGYVISGSGDCEPCGDGSYDLGSAGCTATYCAPCTSGCHNCTGPTGCLFCKDGFIKVSIGGQTVCQACSKSQYQSSATVCTDCPIHCKTCTNSTYCNSCESPYGLSNGQCLLTCPARTYRSSDLKCLDCPDNCTACTNSTYCSGCESGFGFLEGVCKNCTGNLFLNSTNYCENCPTGCETCTSLTNCQTCSTSYKLDTTICNLCPARTFSFAPMTNSTCTNCPIYCSACTDSLTCQSCDSGYGLYNNLCEKCRAGTYLHNGHCVACPTGCTLCTDASTCQDCTTGLAIINNLCQSCPAETYLYKLGCIEASAEDALAVTEGSKQATQAVTQVVSVISSGGSIAFSAAIAGKIFSNIKYLDILYSIQLQEALATWSSNFISLGLSLEMPSTMRSNIEDKPVPDVFDQYEVPSSFLVNFYQNLIIIAIVLAAYITTKIFESFVIRYQSKRFYIDIISRTSRVISQNFLLTMLFSVYGDVIFYAILEYRTIEITWNLVALSLFTSVTLIIVMTVSFIYSFYLLIQYQSLKKQAIKPKGKRALRKFERENEGWQVVFRDFKDDSLLRQSFLLTLTFRDIIFSILLTTSFKHPLLQTIFVLLLNILMIIFLILRRPFDSPLDWAQQIFFEIIGLCVNIGVLILAILDSSDANAVTARIRIGKLIIYVNMVFNFTTAALMVIKMVLSIKETYDAYKFKQYKKLFEAKYQNLQVSQGPPPTSLIEQKGQNTGPFPSQMRPQQHYETPQFVKPRDQHDISGVNMNEISYLNESHNQNLIPNQTSYTQYPPQSMNDVSTIENNGSPMLFPDHHFSPPQQKIKRKRHTKIKVIHPHQLEQPKINIEKDEIEGGQAIDQELKFKNPLSNAYMDFLKRREKTFLPRNLQENSLSTVKPGTANKIPERYFENKPVWEEKEKSLESVAMGDSGENSFQAKMNPKGRDLTTEERKKIEARRLKGSFSPEAVKRLELFTEKK